MIVYLSAEAEYDLETIGDFIARDNPARALSFLRELRSKCLGLERFPLVPRYEASGVRRRVHGLFDLLSGRGRKSDHRPHSTRSPELQHDPFSVMTR